MWVSLSFAISVTGILMALAPLALIALLAFAPSLAFCGLALWHTRPLALFASGLRRTLLWAFV
jgi:hypothetical protein